MNKKFIKIMFCILCLSVLFYLPQSVNAKSHKGINIKKTFVGNVKYQVKRKCDKNKDGYLSKKEVKQVRRLSLPYSLKNNNVKGISKLKYLERLNIEKLNAYNIKEIEQLRRLKYLDLYVYEQPKKRIILDLRKIKKLENLKIYNSMGEMIVKIRKDNKISHLSLNNIKNDEEVIDKCRKLTSIEFNNAYSSCEKLNISNYNHLKKVEIRISKINTCIIKNNPQLKNILIGNSTVSELKMSNLKRLDRLKVSSCNLGKITMKKLNRLRTIIMDRIYDLSTLTIDNLKKLKKIKMERLLDLKSLTLKELPELKDVSCIEGILSELNILGKSKIEYMDFYHNQLKKFEYRNLKKLAILDCENNQLEGRFNFSLYPKLKGLCCKNNYLTEIYGGNCHKFISYIDCYNNNLKLIDFKEISQRGGYVSYLDCKKNPNVVINAAVEQCSHDSTAKIVK